MGVSICGKNLKDAIIDYQDLTSKVPPPRWKTRMFFSLPFFLVQTVCESSSRWFIDNSGNIQASNHTSILDSLPLGIIEVHCTKNLKKHQLKIRNLLTRNCDNCILNCLSKECFSCLLHFLLES